MRKKQGEMHMDEEYDYVLDLFTGKVTKEKLTLEEFDRIYKEKGKMVAGSREGIDEMIKIIVDNVGHSGGGDNHRNVYRLPICILVNINVNSLPVFFFTDLDMLTVTVADGDSVFPEIESSLLFKSFSVDHMKYFFCNFIQYHFSHLLPSYNAASR